MPLLPPGYPPKLAETLTLRSMPIQKSGPTVAIILLISSSFANRLSHVPPSSVIAKDEPAYQWSGTGTASTVVGLQKSAGDC